MIFVKAKINQDVEIKVDLYGDEFRSCCPKCGIENDVSIEDIAQIINDGGDLAGTSIWCIDCSESGDAR